MERLFQAASHQKAWDHFTKAQRKSLESWRKHVAVCFLFKKRISHLLISTRLLFYSPFLFRFSTVLSLLLFKPFNQMEVTGKCFRYQSQLMRRHYLLKLSLIHYLIHIYLICIFFSIYDCRISSQSRLLNFWQAAPKRMTTWNFPTRSRKNRAVISQMLLKRASLTWR